MGTTDTAAPQSQWITEGGISYVRTVIDSEAAWIAFARIGRQGDRPVVAELRVVPTSAAADWNDGPPPDWLTPSSRPIPAGGLTSGHVRSLPLHAHNDIANDAAFWNWLNATAPPNGRSADVSVALTGVRATTDVGELVGTATLSATAAGTLGLSGLAPTLTVRPSRRRPGRPGIPVETYARLASDYVAACAAGRAPIEALAKRWKLDQHVVRNRVAKARKIGLLTFASPGKRGGRLTPAALAILKPQRGKQKRSR